MKGDRKKKKNCMLGPYMDPCHLSVNLSTNDPSWEFTRLKMIQFQLMLNLFAIYKELGIFWRQHFNQLFGIYTVLYYINFRILVKNTSNWSNQTLNYHRPDHYTPAATTRSYLSLYTALPAHANCLCKVFSYKQVGCRD